MYVAASAIRPLLQVRAEATVPTRFGEFNMVVFNWVSPEKDQPSDGMGLSPDHVALVKGNLKGKQRVLCRVHSECLTSEVFGSLKCDCKEQLEAAQAEIARVGEGVIIYLRQEGRGIGLANKIRAYKLQEDGLDTVEANERLGFGSDLRDYGMGAQILYDLGVRKIRLMTNNPRKVVGLDGHKLEIVEKVPIRIIANEHNERYLGTKRDKMGHLL